MTSVLNVDTIADKAGTGPVALTKQEASKARVNANGDTPVINGSFNVSSLTDNGSGNFDFNVTNSFNNANFSTARLLMVILVRRLELLLIQEAKPQQHLRFKLQTQAARVQTTI